MKTTAFASLVLAVGTFGLAACEQQVKDDEPAQPVPDAKPGVSVSNARLVLPTVPGNPGALYFDILNTADDPAELRTIEVQGAGAAMMHDSIMQAGKMTMQATGPLSLAKGQQVSFAPGGKHVMVMQIDPALKSPGRTEVTMTFAGGDKISVEAAIEPPGATR